jgi:hypothetical protein
MKNITQAELKEKLIYDSLSGIFWWKSNAIGRASLDNPAGSKDAKGYCRIMINRKMYLAHRLAWLYVNGVWPKSQIDHIDGNPLNNRYENLRECDSSQNICNSKLRRDSKTGVKGVSWHSQAKKYNVRVCINGKRRSMGLFDDKEFAELVSIEARKKYHGEFARI